MSDERWAKFFELLSEVVNGRGTYQEKKEAVVAEAGVHGAETELEEFTNWFGGDLSSEELTPTE